MFSLIQNKKLVLASAFRANYEAVSKSLSSYFHDNMMSQLNVPAEVLVKLQIDHIHTFTKKMIVSESTKNFTPCAQLLFKIPKGYCLRAFHYQPVLVDCRSHKNTKSYYLPIDSTLDQFIDYEVPLNNQIALCENTSDLVFLELNDEEPVPSLAKTHSYAELVKMTASMMAKNPYTYSTPLGQHLSSIPIKFEASTIINHEPLIDHKIFLQDVMTYLQRI